MKWIFEEITKAGKEPFDPSFVNVSSLPTDTCCPIKNMFMIDSQTETVISSDNIHSINLSFSRTYYISGYKLQVLAVKRYLTGWMVDTSIDGKKFNPLDTKIENLCITNYIHDGVTDCRDLTTREFVTQKTIFKYINLVMTHKDSSQYGYRLQLSAFDLFVDLYTMNSKHSSFPQICRILQFFFCLHNSIN